MMIPTKKYIVLLITFCITLCCSGWAQQQKEEIEVIRKKHDHIETLYTQNQLIEKEVDYICDENAITDGNLIFGYLENDLKLIIHSFSQGHHYEVNNYYVTNNQLFFYFGQINDNQDLAEYDENTGSLLAVEEQWEASEFRLYFADGEAIRCLYKSFTDEDVTDSIKEEFINVADYFENKEKDCNRLGAKTVLDTFRLLMNLQNLNEEEICKLVHLY